MNLSLINDESTEFADAVKQKIVEFNQVQWQGLSRKISDSNYRTPKVNC